MYKAVSDWTAEENYTYPKDTSMERWAFEFLRRNHDYQKNVQDYSAACNSVNPFLEHEYEDLMHYDPPKKHDETEDQWIVRVKRGRITNLNTWYAEKWGLRHLFCPYSEFNTFNVAFKNTSSIVTIAGGGWFKSEKIKIVSTSEKAAFVIDYNLPIPQQLNAIKRYATSHKKWLIKECNLKPIPNKRNRSNLFSVYLRCIDAADARVTESEIAKIFYPKISNVDPDYLGKNKVIDQLKAAKKLRDKDYIYLPLMK